MRGDALLLLHLRLLDEPDEDKGPSAEERLEAELGPELARTVLASLSHG
jgi:hypothetical protein